MPNYKLPLFKNLAINLIEKTKAETSYLDLF